MPKLVITCYNCGAISELEDRLLHSTTCEKCSSYLRCCRNCRFYDPTAYNACREPQAERVKDKEKATYCEFFELTLQPQGAQNTRREESLKKLNQLFKK